MTLQIGVIDGEGHPANEAITFFLTNWFHFALIHFVANNMTNPSKGVGVRITGKNAKKIIKITKKTHRTFASEVNVGVEEYADKKLAYRRDDGK